MNNLSGNIGLIGGILGGVIGILGGVAGTVVSIKATRGPKERAFAVRASVYCWLGVLAFLAGLALIPTPWNLLLWIPYGSALFWSVRRWNGTQARLRAEDAAGAGRP